MKRKASSGGSAAATKAHKKGDLAPQEREPDDVTDQEIQDMILQVTATPRRRAAAPPRPITPLLLLSPRPLSDPASPSSGQDLLTFGGAPQADQGWLVVSRSVGRSVMPRPPTSPLVNQPAHRPLTPTSPNATGGRLAPADGADADGGEGDGAGRPAGDMAERGQRGSRLQRDHSTQTASGRGAAVVVVVVVVVVVDTIIIIIIGGRASVFVGGRGAAIKAYGMAQEGDGGSMKIRATRR